MLMSVMSMVTMLSTCCSSSSLFFFSDLLRALSRIARSSLFLPGDCDRWQWQSNIMMKKNRKIMITMAMIWCICWPTLCVLRLVSAQDDLAVKATTLFFAEGSLIRNMMRMAMLSVTLPPSWVIFDITIMSDDLKGFPLKTQNLAAIVPFHLLQHPVYNLIMCGWQNKMAIKKCKHVSHKTSKLSLMPPFHSPATELFCLQPLLHLPRMNEI